MDESTIRKLAWAAYTLAGIDAALDDLRDTMRQAAQHSPACRAAAGKIARVRRVLRRIAHDVDPVVLEASHILEASEPPPF